MLCQTESTQMGPKQFSRKALGAQMGRWGCHGVEAAFYFMASGKPGSNAVGPEPKQLLSSWSLAGRARYHSRISFQVASAAWPTIGWPSTNDQNVYELRSSSPVLKLNDVCGVGFLVTLHGAHGGQSDPGQTGLIECSGLPRTLISRE